MDELEELKRQNAHQIRLAVRWGEGHPELTVEESIMRWVGKYGGVYREQCDHNKGSKK